VTFEQTGRLAAAEPARVMARLCFHFSRKVQARHDDVRGEVLFPWGRCEFEVLGAALEVRLLPDDAACLQRLREVVDAHVALLSHKRPMLVDWREPCQPGRKANGVMGTSRRAMHSPAGCYHSSH
jgi:uncharacterized protein